MRVDTYLVINARGSIVIRSREPRLAGNEIALRLRLEVPDALFQRPILVAEMAIPKEAIPKSRVDVAVTDNVERLIKEATGLEMRVTVVEHEKDES